MLTNKTFLLCFLSALIVLSCGRGEYMRQQLAHLQALNQADSLLTNDSLAQELCRYFDDHGTANERIEAHYLLGRTYADRGESPAAIAAYHDAADCVDTTATDCDYRMIGSVYAQMARLYHQQLLLSYEIEAHRKASRFDLLAGDTLYALYEQKMVAGAYILENKRDSAELVLHEVINCYHDKGYEQEAIQASTMLMNLYKDQPQRQNDLKKLIDTFETSSKLFDSHHELPPSKRIFYRYKGLYYENIGQLDSAEYYYRKIFRPRMSFVSKNPLYGGLLSVYSKRRVSDSIVKYAQLYCAANDSSIALKDQELIAQITASYRYSHFQKKALEGEKRVRKTEKALWRISLAVLLIIAVGVYGINYYRKYEREKRGELEKKYKEEETKYHEELKRQQRLSIKKENDLLQIHQQEKEELEAAYLQEKTKIEAENLKRVQDMQVSFKRQREEMEIAQQKERAQWVNQQNGFAITWVDKSKEFSDKAICKKVARIATTPSEQMTDSDWKLLTVVFCEHFPVMYKDLCLINGKKRTLRIRIAILTAMGFSNGQQAVLLDETKQTITNNTSVLNEILFGEKTSTTFRANIIRKYNICI